MDNKLPAHIDKYEIVRLLGRGATSSVYLAYDAFTERQVAIKHFSADFLADPEHGATFRKMIATEASLAGRLNHPHIVCIYDAARGADNTYIVMEFVQGETLEKYGQPDQLLSVEKVVEIVFKCALALDFASRNGVIHRDIKPANIMLCADGDVKIADFGAAVLTKSDETQVAGVGSPSYMSPEQIRMDRRGISAEMAMKLSKAFGGSPQFWLNLQNNWEISQLDESVSEGIEHVAA